MRNLPLWRCKKKIARWLRKYRVDDNRICNEWTTPIGPNSIPSVTSQMTHSHTPSLLIVTAVASATQRQFQMSLIKASIIPQSNRQNKVFDSDCLQKQTAHSFFFLFLLSFFFFCLFFWGGGRKERFVLANFPTVACESGIASDWRSGKTLRHQHSGGVGTNSIKLNRYELFLDTNSIIRLLFRMFNVCLHLYRSEIPSKSLRKLPRNCARANEYINNRMNGFYSWIGVFFPLYNPHETGLKT